MSKKKVCPVCGEIPSLPHWKYCDGCEVVARRLAVKKLKNGF